MDDIPDETFSRGPAILADILSRDPIRVWSASGAIIHLWDRAALDMFAAHLADIQRATSGLALGGAVFPNAEHLKFALRKLAYHRDTAQCLCALYPDYLMYNPQKEQKAGNVRIDAVTPAEGGWGEDIDCTCCRCGTRFKVEERESHYTWWGWKALPRYG
ncbi:hypothetical protein [Massilia scottii]|uniref:hypothetical protein n=1 Tax=Massilia scottii TaxID=3057166 RepID=UPI002796CA12|nr:hypothetical protein [Massilia sp. CCM 9029]MDQ1832984.1 hypothetical protein [Massilia sp. CCM 9029]